MRIDAFTATRVLLSLRDKAYEDYTRTHKDCAHLKNKLWRRWDRLCTIPRYILPIEKRIAGAALHFSGYDITLDELKARCTGLEKELGLWKEAADEAEIAYEADIDELLKENDGLKQVIIGLQKGYDSMYEMLLEEWGRGDPDRVPSEEAPADR